MFRLDEPDTQAIELVAWAQSTENDEPENVPEEEVGVTIDDVRK